ncbi:glycoside hydrolase family 172 protein [Nonomuraea sp. NPDC050643]|uniref:glycoside hydrolase family 172 protein n=1 Tax=Nonomuraea sp. NPDC050643 TaxID=3155660 RepID=UPI0033F98701
MRAAVGAYGGRPVAVRGRRLVAHVRPGRRGGLRPVRSRGSRGMHFHAQWRRERPTDGAGQGTQSNREFQVEGINDTGDGNYVILGAEGRGHYVGCVLNIRNLRETSDWNWYGEGDDMIFIDGEPFPPSLHGTGTEDYFNTAWCPTQTYHAPYHGITMPGGDNWSGEISLYRFHIEDPITFTESIRVTIEHGHANKRSDDFSSVAYWYQTLPHRPFGLAPVADRLPFPGVARAG